MRPAIDMVGEVYGELTVVERGSSSNSGALWLCRCSCGGGAEVIRGNLLSGNVKSCGCLLIKSNKIIKWH